MIRIFLILTMVFSFTLTGCETLRVKRVGVQIEAEEDGHHHHGHDRWKRKKHKHKHHHDDRWKREGHKHKKKYHKPRPCPPGHRKKYGRHYECY